MKNEMGVCNRKWFENRMEKENAKYKLHEEKNWFNNYIKIPQLPHEIMRFFSCVGGDGHVTKLIFYKISFNTSNRIIHPQTTTSTLNQQYLDSNHHRHANHNIYTETATSTLKPQHLPSNHNICTQTTTSAFKPQQLHSKNNIFTQPIKSSLKPHNTYSQTTTSSGGTTGVQTVRRTGAHGPRGPIQAPYY